MRRSLLATLFGKTVTALQKALGFSFISSNTDVSDGILEVYKPSDRLADFTVSRGSPSTRVNPQGIIEDVFELGDELVTNGDFSDGSTGWNLGSEWSVVDDEAVSNSVGSFSNINQVNSEFINKTFLVQYDYTIVSGIASGSVYLGGNLVENFTGEVSGSRSIVVESGGSDVLGFNAGSAGNNYSIDNISVKEVSYDIARIDYTNGIAELLTEAGSTNLYLQSNGVVTENTTVTATPYTVSMYGTGTLTFSGTHVGSLVGTGVNDRVEVTFTPTAGTLTTTISGTVTDKQIENLAYATSVIRTSGSTQTRLADSITDGGNVNVINSEEGTLLFEGSALFDDLTSRQIELSDGSDDNKISFRYHTVSNTLLSTVTSSGVLQVSKTHTISDITENSKFAVKWKLNDFALWVNGIEAEIDATITSPLGLNEINLSQWWGGNPFFGRTRQLKVYDRALTDEELTTVTTL